MVVGKKKRLRALCLERPRGDVQDCWGLDWTASTLARDEGKNPNACLLKIAKGVTSNQLHFISCHLVAPKRDKNGGMKSKNGPNGGEGKRQRGRHGPPPREAPMIHAKHEREGASRRSVQALLP